MVNYRQLVAIKTPIHILLNVKKASKDQGKGLRFKNLLEVYAPQDKVIDYLSIDVKDPEKAILERLDFSKWTIRLITVEHKSREDDMKFLKHFFLEKGFSQFDNSLFTNNEYWFYKMD